MYRLESDAVRDDFRQLEKLSFFVFGKDGEHGKTAFKNETG